MAERKIAVCYSICNFFSFVPPSFDTELIPALVQRIVENKFRRYE